MQSDSLVTPISFRLTEDGSALGATLPVRAMPGDAGYDLRAIEDAEIPVWGIKGVKTGVAADFASGFWGMVKERSSLALKGIRVGAGVIDNGYKGELICILQYLPAGGTKECAPFVIKKGDKIAQIIPMKLHSQDETMLGGERGANGFGSTGS